MASHWRLFYICFHGRQAHFPGKNWFSESVAGQPRTSHERISLPYPWLRSTVTGSKCSRPNKRSLRINGRRPICCWPSCFMPDMPAEGLAEKRHKSRISCLSRSCLQAFWDSHWKNRGNRIAKSPPPPPPPQIPDPFPALDLWRGNVWDVPQRGDSAVHPANTRLWTNVGSLLARRLRRRPNNDPTLVQSLVFAGQRLLPDVLSANHIKQTIARVPRGFSVIVR